jgi:hypothetical protein
MFIENVCLNGIKGSEKGSKSENAKFSGENKVDCIFYAKGTIHYEFVLEKQIVKGNIFNEKERYSRF